MAVPLMFYFGEYLARFIIYRYYYGYTLGIRGKYMIRNLKYMLTQTGLWTFIK